MKKKDKKPFSFYPEFEIAVINPQTAKKLIKNHEKAETESKIWKRQKKTK